MDKSQKLKYYLAIDIGASSGRHILGHVNKLGKIEHEEIHRFPNGIVEKNGKQCWDLPALFSEILIGIKKCAQIGKIPESIGIDTWGVDFVLLDNKGEILGDTVAYRDSRTNNMDTEVYKYITETELYSRTGIPRQTYNTIFQLMAIKKDVYNEGLDLLSQAKTLLFIPDYLHYLLCGVAKTEYSIASTSGLLNASTKNWDNEILNVCGFPNEIFQEIVPAGTCLGEFSSEIQAKVGFTAKVVVPPAHDTASAVLAVPSKDQDILFISSGTWSIIGTEQAQPNCSIESMEKGFANEGGFNGRSILLKNIMGLWMIQCVKAELNDKYTFSDLSSMAENVNIKSAVNATDNRFFAPENMIKELQKACEETGQVVPKSPGEIASVIYNSLALCYSTAVKEIEGLTGVTYPNIYVVGGGVNAVYLNSLTSKYTGKKVVTGPAEATGIGNLMAQMPQK